MAGKSRQQEAKAARQIASHNQKAVSHPCLLLLLSSLIQSSILCLKMGLCTSSKIISQRHAQKSTSQILGPIELSTLTSQWVDGHAEKHEGADQSLSETPRPALEAGKDSVFWERLGQKTPECL